MLQSKSLTVIYWIQNFYKKQMLRVNCFRLESIFIVCAQDQQLNGYGLEVIPMNVWIRTPKSKFQSLVAKYYGVMSPTNPIPNSFLIGILCGGPLQDNRMMLSCVHDKLGWRQSQWNRFGHSGVFFFLVNRTLTCYTDFKRIEPS